MNGGSAILPTENVGELPSATKSILEQPTASDEGVYTEQKPFDKTACKTREKRDW